MIYSQIHISLGPTVSPDTPQCLRSTKPYYTAIDIRRSQVQSVSNFLLLFLDWLPMLRIFLHLYRIWPIIFLSSVPHRPGFSTIPTSPNDQAKSILALFLQLVGLILYQCGFKPPQHS